MILFLIIIIILLFFSKYLAIKYLTRWFVLQLFLLVKSCNVTLYCDSASHNWKCISYNVTLSHDVSHNFNTVIAMWHLTVQTYLTIYIDFFHNYFLIIVKSHNVTLYILKLRLFLMIAISFYNVTYLTWHFSYLKLISAILVCFRFGFSRHFHNVMLHLAVMSLFLKTVTLCLTIAMFTSTYFYAHFGISHKKYWMEMQRNA